MKNSPHGPWSFAPGFYRDKRVLVTGHTGFKGSWLCEWLLAMGAHVTGFSDGIPTVPSLFEQLGLGGRLTDLRGDVRDETALKQTVVEVRPHVVFHLAAQALVRQGYKEPVATFATNVMGTVHLLDAVRALGTPCSVVVVTSDKCYENREWPCAYRETDSMGGHDPYSASKGCAELVVSAYRRSFFCRGSETRLASARAGNVIGGGDWGANRLVPDVMRSLQAGAAIPIRNPASVRPWQHVLEPLGGYLLLACLLWTAGREQEEGPWPLDSGFNFGPNPESHSSVGALVERILRLWPGEWQDCSDPHAVHEAGLLMLSVEKAAHVLGWKPVWSLDTAISRTVDWYLRAHGDREADMAAYTRGQLRDYMDAVEPGWGDMVTQEGGAV
ncbi:MAG: CDP-glucose 4,6-dehydratase [Lentisphaerae bacterium]|nr:CDP-glucose 4,6-dehydratase [Lentisphaerota bacterium]